MSALRPDLLTPEEARAREALKSLTAPRADAAFRERLKRDFVAGRIGAPRALVLAAPWYRRPLVRLALAPAAVAALALVVWVGGRGPGWTVMAVSGAGEATVDGAAIPLANVADLARRLRPGARLAVPEGAEVELASAAGLVIQVTPGTEFTLPGTPGRWLNRRVAGAVRHGEIRVTTGGAFAGARLRVDTPEAMVLVTGTTLAVICEPGGTCVCVHDGEVRMGVRGGAMERIPEGRRRFVFNDGRPPAMDAIRPMEGVKLAMFRDGRRSWLEGARR